MYHRLVSNTPRSPWSHSPPRTFNELHGAVGGPSPKCVFPNCSRIATHEPPTSRNGKPLSLPTGALRFWYCAQHAAFAAAEWNLPAPDPKELEAEQVRQRDSKSRLAKKWLHLKRQQRAATRRARQLLGIPKARRVRSVKTGTEALRAMGFVFEKCMDCGKLPVAGQSRCALHLTTRAKCRDCKSPPTSGRSRCAKHLAARAELARISRHTTPPIKKTRKQRTKWADYMRLHRFAKRERGECYECKLDSVRGGRCSVHADRHDEIMAISRSGGGSSRGGRSGKPREMWYELE